MSRVDVLISSSNPLNLYREALSTVSGKPLLYVGTADSSCIDRLLEDVMRTQREKGQGLSEYSLILVFVAIASIAALAIFGDSVKETYYNVVSEFGVVAPAGLGANTNSPDDGSSGDDSSSEDDAGPEDDGGPEPTAEPTPEPEDDEPDNVPGKVVLISPGTFASVGTALTWQARPAAEQVDLYELDFRRATGPNLQNPTIPGTSYGVGSVSEGLYRWRVRAHNAVGWGDWSSWRYVYLSD